MQRRSSGVEKICSVSQINQYIKNLFVRDYLLSRVQVQGEISNLKYHSSGHIYFTLKDEAAQISCVMFAKLYKRYDVPIGRGTECSCVWEHQCI